MGYRTFTAAIWDGTSDAWNVAIGQPGTTFTSTPHDVLKNIVAAMVEGYWTLQAQTGSGLNAIYDLTTTGVGGADTLAIEIKWDNSTNPQNIAYRLGTAYSNGASSNPQGTFPSAAFASGWVLWPVTNGGYAGVLNTRQVTVNMWADADAVAIRTSEPASGYNCGIGPFGLLKSFAGVSDPTRRFTTLPNRVAPSPGATMPPSLFEGNTGFYTDASSYYNPPPGGPSNSTANSGSSVAPGGLALTAIQRFCIVHENYNDASMSWLQNFLKPSAFFDFNQTVGNWWGNNALQVTSGAIQFRNPSMLETMLGIDGNYHLFREWVWQQPGSMDGTSGLMIRGYLPHVITAGISAQGLGTGTIFNAGAEQYILLPVNCGFWAGMHHIAHCIRYA